jgi:hypothetical protein
MLKTSFDRARRTASSDVNFASGTDCESNIFTEYVFFSFFAVVKNNIFINI